MWRWIIRIYVSFMVYVIMLFASGVLLIRVAHLLMKIGSPLLVQWIHNHVLLTMFLLGVVAGQVVLGSNFTGRGWFRSKSGLTYEGFKLEKLKPWTWLFVSPLFLLGTGFWYLEQRELGVLSGHTLSSFYHDFLIPDCSNVAWATAYRDAVPCSMQLFFVGFWMASIGYSLAPIVRKRGADLLRSIRREPGAANSIEETNGSEMKEKTELR
jgi:hypothetical protein